MLHPDIIKKQVIEKYKDYSVEDLKAAYENLIKGEFSFESKEEQMKHDISKANMGRCQLKLDDRSGNLTMYDSALLPEQSALQELIREKTGETYYIKFQTFYYSIEELIDYVLKDMNDPFWNTLLKKFFNQLDDEKHIFPSVEQYIQSEREFMKFHLVDLSEGELNALVEKYKQLYKIEFLLRLANNKESLDNLCKELTSNDDAEEVFTKYESSVSTMKGFGMS